MDMMFNYRGIVQDSKQVVIIDIDGKSLNTIGQWPWSRNTLAQMTDMLIDGNARSIGFNIVFTERDRSSPFYYFNNLPYQLLDRLPEEILAGLLSDTDLDYDLLFAQTLSKGPTVLGYVFKPINDGLKTEEQVPLRTTGLKIHPPDVIAKNLPLIPAYRAVINHPSVSMTKSEGFYNLFSEETGTTRRAPLVMLMDKIPYSSLALETYRIGVKASTIMLHTSKKLQSPKPPVLGIQIKDNFISTDDSARLFINYRGPVKTFKYISAIDIINGSRTKEVNNKFVLIGSSAKGLHDLRATPFSNAIPEVEINATIIDNLIQSDPFVHNTLSETRLTYILILVGGLVIAFILSTWGPLAGSLLVILIIILTILFNYYHFFLNYQYVGVTYPLMTYGLILMITCIYNLLREQKTKRYIKKAFSHYVAKDVVSEMIKNPKSLSLTGEEKDLTVLFSDIRGFTGISEKMPSQALGYFMNNYLSRMSRIIIKNNGTVDKFIGDAIMAFWGAPKDDPMHAYKAVNAAIQMKVETQKMTQEFSQWNLPDIQIGIGINTGQMSVGNFGSNERFDYTVMGDNVNLASRLEGATKNYGTTILISDATNKIISKYFFCQYIDKVQVKGRNTPIDLFEPLAKGTPEKKLANEVLTFENGVKAYQNKEFKKAKAVIEKLYNKSPIRLYKSYLDRIDSFLASSPPPEWTGAERRSRLPVNKLKTK